MSDYGQGLWPQDSIPTSHSEEKSSRMTHYSQIEEWRLLCNFVFFFVNDTSAKAVKDEIQN